MNKARLEAFSDGVFAIVITLLVLDIRIPHVEYARLADALLEIWPKIASYILSFVVIGIYWVAHHYYFKLVSKTNGVFTWLNILLLLLIGFIPFPTSLLGEYPFQTIPVLIYGSTLLAVNFVTLKMFVYLDRHRELTNKNYGGLEKKDFAKVFVFTNLSYIIAIILSPFVPKISYSIYIILLFILVYVYATRKDLNEE